MRKILNEELGRESINTFRIKTKNKIVIVLDNVRSAYNAGSVFRTADAFAVEKIFCCGITASPPNRELLKTSLGAEQSVEWKYFPSTSEAIQELKNAEYKIIAIEQIDKSISLEKFFFNAEEKIALVFGNEVKGVSEEILPMIDSAIEIPQFGTKHSFNISVTVGIVLWEFFRQH
ncbi:MAG TPA: RNA methyltransferase [Bacteroidetes bacterium]|mgnify:CR=1 FL=1|nr:RNA methyltransferase [Bacteroidota bacterium]